MKLRLLALALFAGLAPSCAFAAGSTYLYDSTQATQPSIGTGSGGVSLPVTITGGNVSSSSAGVDGSTTIVTGGTAQNLFGGTTPTNGFEIGNPDATEDCWVSDSTTSSANGTGSFRVALNGGTYTTPGNYKPIGAVSILCTTTGHKITARRW